MEELLKQLTPYVQRYLDECAFLNITATRDDFAGWLFFTIEEEEDA